MGGVSEVQVMMKKVGGMWREQNERGREEGLRGVQNSLLAAPPSPFPPSARLPYLDRPSLCVRSTDSPAPPNRK